MKTKLPEKIVLKVNTVSWNVNLVKGKDDIMLQGDEWEEFVNTYSLKKRDILMFKYNRQECFEVLLFDGTNLCEKEASYFIRKRHQEKNSDDDDEEEEDHDVGRKRKEIQEKGSVTGTEEMDQTSYEEISSSEEVKTTPKKAVTPRRSVLQKRNRSTVKKTVEIQYKSNRRPVTDLETENTLKKAREASKLCTNAFYTVMRPTCVYKRFFMIFKRKQEVVLKVNEKTWLCKVGFNSCAVGFQSTGWRNFARDNFLEEFDVCLFVPSESKDQRYVLDVSIFRVVSQVVPPTLV
ncbi:B3 domain-containing protein REM16 [Bienertia sinuspersici]